MGRIHEAKYIQVDWHDQETANSIKVSNDALVLESIDNNTVEVDVVCFSRFNDGSAGQFAIRLENHTADIPHVTLADGTSMPLRPVTAPDTGHRWWVEGKTWDKKKSYWCSDIFRGVGEVQIKIGSQTCRVKISTSTFTHQQLEQYLLDFQTDFLELIFDESSYINAPVQHNERTLLDKSALLAISRFVECTELVLKNPKVELREVQRLKPRKYVRPVPRTFMELATRGNTRSLTSRAYLESWDVPENRYAHYTVRKVYQITKMLCAVAASQERSLKRSLDTHEQRLANFSAEKKINKEAAQHDLNDTKKAIRDIQDEMLKQKKKLAELVPYDRFDPEQFQGKRFSFIQIKLGEKTIWENTYFTKVRGSEAEPWFPESENCYATFDLGEFDNVIGDLSWSEIEVSGDIGYRKISPEGKKTRHKFELLTVSNFLLIKSWGLENKQTKLKQRLEKQQKQISDLEPQNWVRPLTRDEQHQQELEQASIKKRNALLEAKQLNLKALMRELESKLPSLRAALKSFDKEKVKLDSRFPNSMTYIQNPAYQGIHVESAKIKKGSGINDDEILLALDRIEAIGLVHISLLYERWCLLQIIKVLIKLRYLPEMEWKQKLIAQVLDQRHNISIDFENSNLHRKVKLSYEFELPNKTRPDFVLDVTATYNEEKSVTKRFVMDAKFYEDIDAPKHGGLSFVINYLYNKKIILKITKMRFLYYTHHQKPRQVEPPRRNGLATATMAKIVFLTGTKTSPIIAMVAFTYHLLVSAVIWTTCNEP